MRLQHKPALRGAGRELSAQLVLFGTGGSSYGPGKSHIVATFGSGGLHIVACQTLIALAERSNEAAMIVRPQCKIQSNGDIASGLD